MGYTLDELRDRAEEAAEIRGHTLVWAAPWHGERTSTRTAKCQDCGLGVEINMRPLPNQIDIGGEAVALNCPGRE